MKGIDDFIISFYHLIACWMQGLRLLIVSCPPPPPSPPCFLKGREWSYETPGWWGGGGGADYWEMRNAKILNGVEKKIGKSSVASMRFFHFRFLIFIYHCNVASRRNLGTMVSAGGLVYFPQHQQNWFVFFCTLSALSFSAV